MVGEVLSFSFVSMVIEENGNGAQLRTELDRVLGWCCLSVLGDYYGCPKSGKMENISLLDLVVTCQDQNLKQVFVPATYYDGSKNVTIFISFVYSCYI